MFGAEAFARDGGGDGEVRTENETDPSGGTSRRAGIGGGIEVGVDVDVEIPGGMECAGTG